MNVNKLDLGKVYIYPQIATREMRILIFHKSKMSRLMTKPTKWHVHPAKTQIGLGIRPV